MTMVTVGYGDIVPENSNERIFTIAAMIVASGLFGYAMNIVGIIIREISLEKD